MRYLSLFFLFFCAPLAASESFTLDSETTSTGYVVSFEGVTDPEALALLQKVSDLKLLENSPPDTRFGLRRRADEDMEHIVDALHSLGYYNARIDIRIDAEINPPVVIVAVELGPKYLFSEVTLIPANDECSDFSWDLITPCSLGIDIGAPALPKDILASEEELLHIMATWGYPFGKIIKRDVIADQQTKTIALRFTVDPGPFGYFGKTQIFGVKKTNPYFFKKRIRWHEGSRYKPCQVERTQEALEDSGIFSSVNISLGEADPEGFIPMEITVDEAKQRSIGFGVSYSTLLGAGVAAEWEHRNLRGMGERLSTTVSIWQKYKEANIAYAIPYFGSRRQKLILIADLDEDITKGYTARAASFSATIVRKLNVYSQLSYGSMVKILKDTRSDNDRAFTLFKAPIQYRWSNADSLLDPHHGFSVDLRSTPSVQIFAPSFYYQTNVATVSTYFPLTKNITLAGKVVAGSIFGSPDITIPPSERFYAGTDTLLRGYQYKTVSPLKHNDPIGGRSMLIYSFEYRQQLSENWGWIGFYDVGNVYKPVWPPFGNKVLQSVGVGIRYFTAVGPIRADFAFPLNPRKDLDKAFQFYISIGQAF